MRKLILFIATVLTSNGHKGSTSVKQALAKHAAQPADKRADRAAVRKQMVDVSFQEYDWTLNDVK